jgi:hypothetical protein
VLASAISKESVKLPGPVADQGPEVRSAITEIHQEVPGLLRGPRSVRVRGDPEDMHVAGTDLDHEQAVQTAECYRAVHVEEIGREHRRGLGVQELAPRRVGVALRHRGNPQGPEDPADRGGADPVAEPEQLALDPLVYPRLLFSVARRSMSAAISALTGGRPVRFG